MIDKQVRPSESSKRLLAGDGWVYKHQSTGCAMNM